MTDAKRHYTARCHCGNVRFSFFSEEITLGKRCNCSMCVRKGALMSAKYIPAADFTAHVDRGELSDYRWGDGDVNHLFCKTCGIYPYHGDDQCGYRVNLGCVEGLDTMTLEVGLIDGRSLLDRAELRRRQRTHYRRNIGSAHPVRAITAALSPVPEGAHLPHT